MKERHVNIGKHRSVSHIWDELHVRGVVGIKKSVVREVLIVFPSLKILFLLATLVIIASSPISTTSTTASTLHT